VAPSTPSPSEPSPTSAGIRIAKTGAEGEIFTGIGSLGRTRRVRWNDFYGAGDKAVAYYSNARFGRTSHFISLHGTSGSFKSDLNDEQRAFVIAFLREHIFGAAASAADVPVPATALNGKTIGIRPDSANARKGEAGL
jgi:hypothetical protein